MSTLPCQARAVVIGCGIVGNSLAYHLTDQGWSDVVLLDKGPLPNTGGSTGHASNFLFLVDHSKEMTQLTLESARQYRELGVYTECGGIEVARTEERMEELRRRMASAKSWGVEPVFLLTPAEVKELVPYIDESDPPRRLSTRRPSGVVDSLRAGTLQRGRASPGAGAHSPVLRQHGGRSASTSRAAGVRRVRHDRCGTIEAEVVVIAGWRLEPARSREMAGAADPAHPGRAPDDRRRPRPALRAGPVACDRVPDRARHGHEHVRAQPVGTPALPPARGGSRRVPSGRRTSHTRAATACRDPGRSRGDSRWSATRPCALNSAVECFCCQVRAPICMAEGSSCGDAVALDRLRSPC